MNRFAVFQQDYAKDIAVRFWNPAPSSDSSVRLNEFFDRIGNDPFNPFESYIPAIRPLARM